MNLNLQEFFLLIGLHTTRLVIRIITSYPEFEQTHQIYSPQFSFLLNLVKIAICSISGENEQFPMSLKFETRIHDRLYSTSGTRYFSQHF